MAARLKETYVNEVAPALMKKFEYKSVMQIPKLDKIVINMGVGEAKENAKVLDTAIKDLETITGQKAVVTRAKKSVANFKLREGMRQFFILPNSGIKNGQIREKYSAKFGS